MTLGLLYGKKLYHSFKERITNNGILSDQKNSKDALKALKYFNGSDFIIRGKYHQEKNFHRLPAKYEKIVRPEVWRLSKNSAGISILFTTNSPIISVKWELANNSSPANMYRIATSGLDLYCLINGNWQYANSAIPTGFSNESLLISDMDTTSKEFILNLPLYDGVNDIQIGIDRKYSISSPDKGSIDTIKKPIVFYGTSITQGAGASRPGMAYPSIISRKLHVETINLGFSGNGIFEASVGQALCEIDASLYVIDCTPNSDPETIRKNALKLIQQIRNCKPKTPILLIESIIRENSYLKTSDEFTSGGLKYIQAQNRELRQSFDMAVKMGINDIYYLESHDLIGSDHEGTVDGTHPSDLGMYRMAEKIMTKITEIQRGGLTF